MMKWIKIALGNVRKSIQDYTIYFITLTLAVCIFYVFNSFDSQKAIMTGSASRLHSLELLNQMMSSISVFVSVILGFLIIYANKFLISRRKKELALYHLLGMNPRQISAILIIETITAGFFSLISGLLLGVLFSQITAIITTKLLHVQLGTVVFIFSKTAAFKTIVFFGLSFLLVIIFHTSSIRKQTLIQLLYARQKQDARQNPNFSRSATLGIGSIAALGIAYFSVLCDFPVFGDNTLFVSVLLGIGGTYFFFDSLMGFLLEASRKHPGMYLKGLNPFLIGQIKKKLKLHGFSLTVICLMLFVSIVTLSSGFGISSAVSRELKKNAPYDVTCRIETDSPQKQNPDLLASAALQIPGFYDVFSKSSLISFYDGGSIQPNNSSIELDFYFISISDFNNALEIQGKTPILLPDYSYAINTSLFTAEENNFLGKSADSYLSQLMFGSGLTTSTDLFFNYTMINQANRPYEVFIILPDDYTTDFEPIMTVILLQYAEPSDEDHQVTISALKKFISGEEGSNKTITTKLQIQEKIDSDMLTLEFISIYIGIVFLIASAAILAIIQLAETSDSLDSYVLLQKLGVSDSMMSLARLKLLLFHFGSPMILALAHSVVGITVFSKIIYAFNKGSIVSTSLVSAAIILFIYGLYFFVTYISIQRILSQKT